jgi:hypothetical protein
MKAKGACGWDMKAKGACGWDRGRYLIRSAGCILGIDSSSSSCLLQVELKGVRIAVGREGRGLVCERMRRGGQGNNTRRQGRETANQVAACGGEKSMRAIVIRQGHFMLRSSKRASVGRGGGAAHREQVQG